MTTKRAACILRRTVVLALLPLHLAARAQQAAPAAPAQEAPAPAAPAAPASLAISAAAAAPEPKFLTNKYFSVSGVVDGYYDYDANHPHDGSGFRNYTQLRNFDIRPNTVSLTEAKLTLAHDPAGKVGFGFRTDVGFGSALDIMHPANPSGTGLKYVEQMFVSLKPAALKGVDVDFGQFVTSAGAEVIESADNWNYSRSLLFALAIPYYHFGLRASAPVGPTLTLGVQVVQGWNNIFDNNSGKTVGLTGALAKKYYTLNANYYVGPENNNTNHGYRNLFDTTLLLTPAAKLNAYINYDYGQNRNPNAALTGTSSLAHWQGVAGAVHYAPTAKLTATVRAEYYSDPNGFTTGLAQKLNEVTVTGDYLIKPGVLARAEYRRDHSDHRFFNYNKVPSSSNDQNTFEVSLIGFFGPKT